MAKGSKAPGKPARGRRRVVGVGDRLTRAQIALRSRIDRETVTKYLAMEGAPKPDKAMRYSYRVALEWIQKNAPRLASSEEMKKIRESMLRMEAEDMAIDLAVKRGRYVDKSAIEPTIAAFMTQLTDDLRTKFEQELPPKYDRMTTVERQQANALAIDWVLGRLKTGADPISK